MFRRPGRLYRVVAVLCLILSSCSAVGKDRDTWQQPDRIISDLGMKPGTKVADIGCGQGYFALRLAKSVGEQGLVFAVDTDASALDALKKKNSTNPRFPITSPHYGTLSGAAMIN